MDEEGAFVDHNISLEEQMRAPIRSRRYPACSMHATQAALLGVKMKLVSLDLSDSWFSPTASLAGRQDAVVRPVCQDDSDATGSTIFDSSLFRTVSGLDRVLSVELPSLTGSDQERLLFACRGDHAVYLARTATLTAATVEKASAALFSLPNLRFVIFEDVHQPQTLHWRPRPLSFRYLNDWVVSLRGADAGVPASIRRETERKLRRLMRERRDVRLFMHEHPGRDLVETIVEMNRRKIESGGQAHRIDEAGLARLTRLCAEVGTAAVIYDGDHLVSGDLFVEHGRSAYFLVGGYDPSYGKDSPGMISLRFGIEHFQIRDFDVVHLMWGDNPYKIRLGGVRVPLSSHIVQRDSATWFSTNFIRAVARLSWLDVKCRVREHPRLSRAFRVALRCQGRAKIAFARRGERLRA